MADRRTIAPGYEPVAAISEGATSAFLRSLQEDPDTNQRVLRQITRVNPQLALRIARTARVLAEAQISPDNAYVAGALFLAGCIATQADADHLEALFTTDPLEEVIGIGLDQAAQVAAAQQPET